ncbi:PLAT/LH2 domain-containing protein [Hyalangium sp.]|uniref:PLAT/LH2 domain-containing protein n=1 Tax=Hyalangium sp. TaxID=2028555 RepID=UPI0039C86C4F
MREQEFQHGVRLDGAEPALDYFSLKGTNGEVGTRIDATPPGLFKRGQTNKVTLLGASIGTPQTLSVNRSTRGNGPDWHLQSIKVDWIDPNEVPRYKQATFNTWVLAMRGASRSL